MTEQEELECMERDLRDRGVDIDGCLEQVEKIVRKASSWRGEAEGRLIKYRENPKTKGSGIVCCIPQSGRCKTGCKDCFFQGGRSYLEPLEENVPNIPPLSATHGRVVRMNDGNDSNQDRERVLKIGSYYRDKFYNTACPDDLEGYGAPVVLTVNPGRMTDTQFHKVDPISDNLMFVRVRTNTWNLEMVDEIVSYYAVQHRVPVVLTFMAYFTGKIPGTHHMDYMERKRTMNTYTAITTSAWRRVMDRYSTLIAVSSCGKIEGEAGSTLCRRCGNCLREYYATKERMREEAE